VPIVSRRIRRAEARGNGGVLLSHRAVKSILHGSNGPSGLVPVSSCRLKDESEAGPSRATRGRSEDRSDLRGRKKPTALGTVREEFEGLS
jgi:hypothetical protein